MTCPATAPGLVVPVDATAATDRQPSVTLNRVRMARDAMTVGLSPKNGWVSHIEGHDVARFSTATRHFVALCHPDDIDHVLHAGRLNYYKSYEYELLRAILGVISAGFARAVAGGRMSADAKAQYASHWGPGDFRRQLLLGGPTIAELLAPDVLDASPFRVPVTAVWGDRDWISPARGAAALRHSHPEVTTRVLGGTGHCPQYDRPDLVAELISGIIPLEEEQ